MKKALYLIALFIIAWAYPTSAQFKLYEYITYDWDSYPKLTHTNQDTSNNSVIIFTREYHEFTNDENTLYDFKIIHKRVKLITHEGIENNNKVYIPLDDIDKILSQKARVIKRDGSVRELSREDFKEGYYEETGKKYRYFAFEGIETGCEIEYLYCVKHNPDLNGDIINIQNEQPILLYETRYTTPSCIWLKFKSFNSCPEAVYDITDPVFKDKFKDKNIWVIRKENIPGLKDEDNSAPKAAAMKFGVKLDRISHTGKRDLYSYATLSANIYHHIYNQNETKDFKLIANCIPAMHLVGGTEEDSIRLVENYLKTNFIYDPNAGDDKTVLSKIFANKVYNDFGATLLFANIFRKLNIKTEIVLTCDRFGNRFDKDYECYAFLNEYILYFPAIKKYLSPADNLSRLGFPEYEYVNTYGLFIHPEMVDGKISGLDKIRFIEGATSNESIDKLSITAQITPAFSDTRLSVVRELSGYVASAYQPYFDFIKEENKLKDLSEELVKYVDKQGNIEDLIIENKGGNFLGQKPLIAKAVITSNSFFDRAGDKYLFKAGMLIGPQKGLYDKDERKLPLEFPFSRMYSRSITFNIPEGYKVSGLEKLKINESHVRNGSDTCMLFVSDYRLADNTVTVSVEEYYKEYNYTVAEFEEYRRVANAAANFNKVVLVFEKK